MGKNRNKNSKLEKLTITFPVLIICILTKSYCNIPLLNSQDGEFNFCGLEGRRGRTLPPTKRAGQRILQPALNIHLRHICRYITD